MDIFVLSSTNEPGYQTWQTANGVTCSDHFLYPEGENVLQKPYESYVESINAYFSVVQKYAPKDEAFLYCISSGHDERPRLYLNAAANTPESIESVRQKLPFYTDRSPQLFREALLRTKALMDSSSSPLKNFLTIYAWNEWNEGGIIEPNEKDGATYLLTIADVFHLHRGRHGRN